MGAGARLIRGFLYENSGWGDMTEINVAIVVGSSRRKSINSSSPMRSRSWQRGSWQ